MSLSPERHFFLAVSADHFTTLTEKSIHVHPEEFCMVHKDADSFSTYQNIKALAPACIPCLPLTFGDTF